MKVLLLAGGDSPEREVSLISGKAVYGALKNLGHEIVAIDPVSANSLLDKDGIYQLPAVPTNIPTLVKSADSPIAFYTLLRSEPVTDIDVVFIALHGGKGEDGSIQSLLDLAGKKYTGSGRVPSTIAMDKALTKQLAVSVAVPTPEWKLFRAQTDMSVHSIIDDIQKAFTLPVIIKPNDSGSTIGLTCVKQTEQIPQAVKEVLKVSSALLVEQYISGREVTVAVLNGEPLPVVEIKPVDGLYDYEAKYTKGKSQYFVPADIETAVTASLQQAAVRVYNIIGAEGLARVDFILDAQNRYYFLELNTLPGMTELSLAPMAAKAAGIGFEQLVQILLETALKR